MGQQWEPMLDELAGVRRGRLVAFATMLAGASVAEDLVQEAVIATFSKRRGFTDVVQAEHYVRRAIATKHVDHMRKAGRARERDRQASVPQAVPDHADRIATNDAVDAALAALPARVRTCVVLRHLEGLSVRETAHVMGLSEGAVKRYTSDGLALMNDALGTTSAQPETTTVHAAKGESR
ncbi:sigma-70 family RNA polymerase sigma factor [Demequina sp.]|uniref:sigma-70 family RNA polymerase sigma factor n=1 Tax=Demequina sp. TaxID=2050685 RepID=UPI003A838721